LVGSRTTQETIVAIAAEEVVITKATVDEVVPSLAEREVIRVVSLDDVVPFGNSDNFIVASERRFTVAGFVNEIVSSGAEYCRHGAVPSFELCSTEWGDRSQAISSALAGRRAYVAATYLGSDSAAKVCSHVCSETTG
jgi:hypothetical protein